MYLFIASNKWLYQFLEQNGNFFFFLKCLWELVFFKFEQTIYFFYIQIIVPFSLLEEIEVDDSIFYSVIR